MMDTQKYTQAQTKIHVDTDTQTHRHTDTQTRICTLLVLQGDGSLVVNDWFVLWCSTIRLQGRLIQRLGHSWHCLQDSIRFLKLFDNTFADAIKRLEVLQSKDFSPPRPSTPTPLLGSQVLKLLAHTPC